MDNASMCYYFDTSALLKTTELMRFKQQLPPETGIEEAKRLVLDHPKQLYLSTMTVLECYDVFRQAYRSETLGKNKKTKFKNFNMIREPFERNMQQFQIIPICQEILNGSIEILLDHAGEHKIGSNDAIHLAFVLAQQPQMTMVTFDRAMKNVCEQLNLPVIFPMS